MQGLAQAVVQAQGACPVVLVQPEALAALAPARGRAAAAPVPRQPSCHGASLPKVVPPPSRAAQASNAGMLHLLRHRSPVAGPRPLAHAFQRVHHPRWRWTLAKPHELRWYVPAQAVCPGCSPAHPAAARPGSPYPALPHTAFETLHWYAGGCMPGTQGPGAQTHTRRSTVQ